MVALAVGDMISPFIETNIGNIPRRMFLGLKQKRFLLLRDEATSVDWRANLEVHARLLARIKHTPTPAPAPRLGLTLGPTPAPRLGPTLTRTLALALAQQGSSSPGPAPSSKVATLLLQHKFRLVAQLLVQHKLR
ncbi:hypothetical protein AAG906_016605 [Vitis piasezkii]